MPISKSALLAFFALACVPSCATADEAMKSSAAWPAIEKARDCDDAAAIAFSRLANESAEQVAKAAFDKCYATWDAANQLYFNTMPHYPYLTEKDIHKKIALLSLETQTFSTEAARNNLEAWKAAEIDRLRVLVMETRLKNVPAP
jgi:hypothetical protein